MYFQYEIRDYSTDVTVVSASGKSISSLYRIAINTTNALLAKGLTSVSLWAFFNHRSKLRVMLDTKIIFLSRQWVGRGVTGMSFQTIADCICIGRMTIWWKHLSSLSYTKLSPWHGHVSAPHARAGRISHVQHHSHPTPCTDTCTITALYDSNQTTWMTYPACTLHDRYLNALDKWLITSWQYWLLRRSATASHLLQPRVQFEITSIRLLACMMHEALVLRQERYRGRYHAANPHPVYFFELQESSYWTESRLAHLHNNIHSSLRRYPVSKMPVKDWNPFITIITQPHLQT